MTIKRVAAPLPVVVEHYLPELEDKEITFGTGIEADVSTVSGSSYTGYYTYKLEWAACAATHFPVNVGYRIVSQDKSIRSAHSQTYELAAPATYVIYARQVASTSTPGTTTDDAGPWEYQSTESDPVFSYRLYSFGDEGFEHVQFAICGPVNSTEGRLAYDAGGDMTGMYTSTGTDYGPGNDYQIKLEDDHVIGITAPLPKGY